MSLMMQPYDHNRSRTAARSPWHFHHEGIWFIKESCVGDQAS